VVFRSCEFESFGLREEPTVSALGLSSTAFRLERRRAALMLIREPPDVRDLDSTNSGSHSFR
jgi:hypothetical protein